MFVRMQIPASGEKDGLLITDRAVGSDQGQKFVYVLLAGDKVDQRPVTLGPVIDGLRVVVQGLKPDDQVIINGVMKVRPGSQVKAEQGKMEQFASDQLEVKPSRYAEGRGRRQKPRGATETAMSNLFFLPIPRCADRVFRASAILAPDFCLLPSAFCLPV